MRYKAIFIDIDDTLLDYIPCCREAFHSALSALERPGEDERWAKDEEALFQLFFDISGRLFSEAKHGLHTVAEVMDLYPAEFIERMGEVTDQPVPQNAREAMTEVFKHAFRAAWGETHSLVPETIETLEGLQNKGYRLFAASNSFGHLQRRRLDRAGILGFFESTFISMDIGHDKPDRRFFEYALREADLQAEEVLMVGDSMTTDIIGAQKAGLATCFFNRRAEQNDKAKPDFEISRLSELLTLV